MRDVNKPLRRWRLGWRLLRGLLWTGLGGAACGLVFILSFYAAMRYEMRATDVLVPELVRLASEQARERAAAAGLRVEIVEQRHDAAVPSGYVLEQQPQPGFRVRRGRKVKLVVSLGSRVLEVPPIVGQPSRTVSIHLQRQGFSPGEESFVYSWDAPEGTVLAQVPAPGSPALAGERVHRLVSLGPAERVWVMPDLRGLPRREVESWLRGCGFRMSPPRYVRGAGHMRDTVVSQRPLPGYPVRPRDVVHLTLAR